MVGLVIGFAGIVLVSTGALGGHISTDGVTYAVVGAVVWAIGTIAFKRNQDKVDHLWAVAIPFVAGGLVLTMIGAITEGFAIAWTARFVAALIYASLIGTALAWGLWLGLVASDEASPRVGVHLHGAGGRRAARRADPRRDVPPGAGGRQRAGRGGDLPGQPQTRPVLG